MDARSINPSVRIDLRCRSFLTAGAMRHLITICALVITTAACQSASKAKKLIEFGWDEPSTGFMREHISTMERAPFDGVVFNVHARKTNGSKFRFTWEAWSTNRFFRSDLREAVDDLRATRFQRFTDNFLRFNTTPAKLDWFDDYSAVISNCHVAAWAAKQGGVKGLLFDIEQYEGQLFDYRKQRNAKSRSWDDYAAKVRERGREVMTAFQAEYPEVVVFLTFGYSLPWLESHGGKGPLADCHYGLLAPFIDGMLDVAKAPAVLIDGNESAYPFRDTNRFATSYQTMKQGVLPIVAAPEKYARHFSFSFGLWMDYDWRKLGWGTDNVSTNYYTPAAFEQSIRTALHTADEYVWIYTEQPRWWSEKGEMIKVPESYLNAIRAARNAASTPRP